MHPTPAMRLVHSLVCDATHCNNKFQLCDSPAKCRLLNVYHNVFHLSSSSHPLSSLRSFSASKSTGPLPGPTLLSPLLLSSSSSSSSSSSYSDSSSSPYS